MFWALKSSPHIKTDEFLQEKGTKEYRFLFFEAHGCSKAQESKSIIFKNCLCFYFKHMVENSTFATCTLLFLWQVYLSLYGADECGSLVLLPWTHRVHTLPLGYFFVTLLFVM